MTSVELHRTQIKQSSLQRSTILYIAKVFLILISIFLIAYNNSIQFSKFLSFYVLFINVFAVLLSRNNRKSFVVFIFLLWFNYSILIANLISPFDNFFTRWKADDAIIVAVNLLVIFMTTIFVIMPFQRFKNENGPAFPTKNNPFVFWGLFLVLFILFILQLYNSFGALGRTSSSSVYEYSLVLFIFAYYYSGKDKFRSYTLTALLILFCLQDLLLGNRVTALQLLVCFFLIKINKKFRIVHLIPFAIAVFFVFSAVGIFRGVYSTDGNIVKTIYDGVVSEKLSLDTAYSAFFTSLTFIKVRDVTIFSERLSLFYKFLGSIIFGGSLSKGANLATYTKGFYDHWNGGILPYFGYFYFGYCGAFIFSLYTAIILRLSFIQKGKGDLRYIIGIYITCTVSRWYLYSPSSITHGVLIIIILFFVLKFLNFNNSLSREERFNEQ